MTELNFEFSQGAQITLPNLLRLHRLASLLPLPKQRKIFNEFSGQHSSKIRGRGMDFSDVRIYQAGDDLRTVDWRVTARTSKAHVKVYHEERERPILLACDLRAAMYFGSHRAFKSVLAADLATLLAWAALNAGDRVGALIFNDDSELDLRPKAGKKNVLHLINELCQIEKTPAQDESASMRRLCQHLRQVTRPGSQVYFISDFSGLDSECEQQLHFISRHSDITALQLFDPLEEELPPPGIYPISDGHSQFYLNSIPEENRSAFKQQAAKNHNDLKMRLMARNIPLIRFNTATASLATLRTGLGLPQGKL